MTERVYTVREIDDLRRVVERKYLFGSYGGRRVGISRAYHEAEKVKAVEEMVRTHMLAGHTAADLLESEEGGSST